MRTLLVTGSLGGGLLVAGGAAAANVRGDHARMLCGDGKGGFGTSVAQFTARCTGNDPVYANRCKYMGGGQSNPGYMPGGASDTAGMAAAYLLWGGAQRCTNAASW